MAVQPHDRDDFEIGIICALQSEANAVEALFDKYWDEDGDRYGKAIGDPNSYTTGAIGRHNIVLAHMPGIGKSSAASVAASFRSSFGRIKLALVVGICGGVPFGPDNEEILLGDVIISTGIIQYDFGRQLPDRFARKDTLEDNLGRPSTEIRAFLSKMGGYRGHKYLQENTFSYLQELYQNDHFRNAQYPGELEDKLYEPTYRHKHHESLTCHTCTNCIKKEDEVCNMALESFCSDLKCDKTKLVQRQRLLKASDSQSSAMERKPYIHFGLIASGDRVLKSGEDRDQIAAREKVIGFEMESAGVWDNFPCIVIKGVCDYADCHKNKTWQGYAAVTAAACMKAFLKAWVSSESPLSNGVVQSNPKPFLVTLGRSRDIVGNQSHSSGQQIGPSTSMETFEGDGDTTFYQLEYLGIRPVSYFASRSELQQLEMFFAESPLSSSQSRVACLVGLGGSGKTQLMLQYAHMHRESYGTVLWFDCQTVDSLNRSFVLAARLLGIWVPPPSTEKAPNEMRLMTRNPGNSHAVSLLLRWLSRRQKPWLLLFDEADDLEMIRSLMEYFPSNSLGHIIVSSRRDEASSLGISTKVGGLPPQSAQLLLLHHARLPGVTDEHQHLVAEIVKQLDYIALAIDLAGAYIHKLGSLETYLRLYKTSREELLKRAIGTHAPIASGYNMSAYAAWKVSIDGMPARTAQFLYLLCFLDPTNITDDLFRRACTPKNHWDEYGNEGLLHPMMDHVPLWLLQEFCDAKGKWDEMDFLEHTSELCTCFFLEMSQAIGASVHHLSFAEDEDVLNPEPMRILQLPQTIHSLGKAYLEPSEREMFSRDAAGVVMHAFKNDIKHDFHASKDHARDTVFYFGPGGAINSPTKIVEQFEEMYGHIEIFGNYLCRDSDINLRTGFGRYFKASASEQFLFAFYFAHFHEEQSHLGSTESPVSTMDWELIHKFMAHTRHIFEKLIPEFTFEYVGAPASERVFEYYLQVLVARISFPAAISKGFLMYFFAAVAELAWMQSFSFQAVMAKVEWLVAQIQADREIYSQNGWHLGDPIQALDIWKRSDMCKLYKIRSGINLSAAK